MPAREVMTVAVPRGTWREELKRRENSWRGSDSTRVFPVDPDVLCQGKRP